MEKLENSDVDLGWVDDAEGEDLCSVLDDLFGDVAEHEQGSQQDYVHIQFQSDQPYRLMRRADGCHVEVKDIELASKLFWYSRLKNPRLIDYDKAQRAATTAGFAVLFRDGTWDVLPGYQPDEREHAFWTAVAARFAQLPEWVF